MNTQIPTAEKDKKNLPQLLKQSVSYKLKVPKKVEEKIRYLLRKYPTTEWSGVLFYTHTGTFKDNNLIITCEDFYPMDLGDTTFTQFKMSEEVTAYIAENMELFDCDLGLIHSHHTMSTFFSSTDLSTLQEEGNDRNCFVSLIVNNAGVYNAAITRKVQSKHEVTIKNLGTSYEFFGDGPVQTAEDGIEKTKIVDKEVIQYFMLEVEREDVSNPFAWLDDRFVEIQAKKESKKSHIIKFQDTECKGSDFDVDFYSWLRKEKGRKKASEELPLFPAEEIEESKEDIKLNDAIFNEAINVMLTCSLIPTYDIAIDDWVKTEMEDVYSGIIFKSEESFTSWKEFIIDFVLNNYFEFFGIGDFEVQNYIVNTLINKLNELQQNKFIEEYKSYLVNYLYE